MKIYKRLALLVLAVFGMLCLTQCKQAQQESFGSEVTVDEMTQAEIVIKDENSVEEDNNVIEFGGESPEQEITGEASPEPEDPQSSAETTPVPGAEPGTPDGYGDFF